MVNPALLWLDIETTGLKDSDQILAIGVVLTGPALEQIWFKEWYVYHNNSIIAAMPLRVADMHTRSGLFGRIFDASRSVDMETIFDELMNMLAEHTKRKHVYLAGSSIHFDRRFIRRDCPPLDDWLHYRMLDVSTLRVIIDLFNPQPKDIFEAAHTPLADIRRTLELFQRNIELIQGTKFQWPTFIW